ncbi:MAG: hypothetical protein MHMPM18_002627 [Marteilia pararefringens]
MGSGASKMQSINVPIIGLDRAGKSSIMHCICKNEESIATLPTIGFATDHMQVGRVKWSFWDLAGQERSRTLWNYYLLNVSVLIFVVDSSDRERINKAAEELKKALKEEMKVVPIIVYSNKQDLPEHMSDEEVSSALALESTGCKFKIFPCSAVRNEGIQEGIDWVMNSLSTERNSKKDKKKAKSKGKKKSKKSKENFISID